MVEQSISQNDKSTRQAVSWQRYGHDLAYMLKRLDNMDRIIHEQQMLLSQLVLQFCDLRDSRSEKPVGKRVMETRGNCRIIQFFPSWSK